MDISRLREALRQGCVDPFAACVHWKDSPSTPAPPNYTAAAQAQQTNQVTPFGTGTWTPGHPAIPGVGGTPDRPGAIPGTIIKGTPGVNAQPATRDTYTVTLPDSLQRGLLGIEGRVGQNMSQQPDLSSVNDVANKAYGALTSRLDPQWQQNTQQEETQLRNQGLVPGDEAYNNAMRVFNQAKNDAYQQANLGAIQTMPQTYQLATDIYNQPLNQLNAIRSGAQIEGPQFTGPPNYLGAAGMQGQYNQGLYNAQVGQQNAMTSGLFGLGSAGLMYAALA